MPALMELCNVLVRWLHIASVAVVVGGFFYGGIVACRDPAADAAKRFRGWFYAASAGLIVSGLYQFFAAPGHTRRYETLLGMKLLLVAHVLGVGFVLGLSGSPHPRRNRLMAGAAISGLGVILISAYLKRIF